MDARSTLADHVDAMVALRRDLHAHPEIGLEEHRTAGIVAGLLAEWGWRVETGIARTGIVGTLTRGSSRRSIGLRADMDALPMDEETGLPWASRHPGRMHACGHDGHTAMLLAAARALAEAGRFDGTVHVIFQPAEENAGGARLMMDEGLFRRFPCEAVFGLHNLPGLMANVIGVRPGPLMASVEEVRIVLHGKGGHGATPQVAADPVVAGASLVMALQTIVSRNLDPMETGIVTVGAFQAGHVCNVIPEHATLSLGLRAFAPEVAELLRRRVKELAADQARSFGVTAETIVEPGYPPVVNDPAMTAVARAAAAFLLGEHGVLDLPRPYPFGEDFAFMLEEVPGSYVALGQGEHRPFLHHPAYDFEDATLVTGAAYWVTLAERFLAPA